MMKMVMEMGLDTSVHPSSSAGGSPRPHHLSPHSDHCLFGCPIIIFGVLLFVCLAGEYTKIRRKMVVNSADEEEEPSSDRSAPPPPWNG